MELTEDDVPGAKLKFAKVKDHLVRDLKRWLACRSLPMSGNKNVLVERIEECIANGNDKKFFIGIDGGKCLEDKKQRMKLLNPNLPSFTSCTFPSSNWANFPSQAIPRTFCYATMYNYITSGPTDSLDVNDTLSDDDEQLPNCGNSKALQRGRHYCLSDFVLNMEDNVDDLIYYLRADVKSSFRVTVTYKINIALDKNNSKIIDAQCQCPASASKNCSHIVALLYKLEEYTVRYGYDALTCTSKLKEWNKGRKLGNNPDNILTANYPTKRKYPKKSIVNFIPKKTKYLNDNHNKNQSTSRFVQIIQSKKKTNCMWNTLLNIKYDSYDLSLDEKLILKLKISQLIMNLTPVESGAVEIDVEQNTWEWLTERQLRITASECKNFFTSTDLTNLINNKLWCKKDISHLPQIVYGRENEANAIIDFEINNNVIVKKCGLFVNKLFPGLGCSPDGLIFENEKLVSCIEVKCPQVLKNCSPFQLDKVKNYKNLCYTVKGNQIHLKRNHCYYYQIQLTLAILELEYCDFIVWSGLKTFATERINRDEIFINTLTQKLLKVHKILAGEFFEMRLPRNLSLFLIED